MKNRYVREELVKSHTKSPFYIKIIIFVKQILDEWLITSHNFQ